MIDKILNNNTETKFIHPLGNRQHCHPQAKHLLIARNEALVERKYRKYSSRNCITERPKKYMLSADKGTASNDLEKQAIFITYINDDGFPKENLISVAVISDKSATGAANHLKKEVSEMISLKDIVVLCTDGASVYVEKHKGMMRVLKKSQDLDKHALFLPDVCHKTERLFLKAQTEIVKETLNI